MNTSSVRQYTRGILEETIRKSFDMPDSSGAGQEGEFNFAVVEDVLNTISSADMSLFGYNMLSAEQPSAGVPGMMQVNVSLQHLKPDFGKYIDKLVARGGKFAKIYSDSPNSKTKLTRWLTGFKEGSEIDSRQKSAAIKIAQLAGLDALEPLLDSIEAKYDVTCTANFTGAKTNKKGQSFFEIFIMPPRMGAESGVVPSGPSIQPPQQPIVVPVDTEPVSIPASVAEPKKKKARKPRKKRKVKMPKLTSKQRKAGYNQINSQGHIRHILEPDELQDISDHIVELVLGSGAKEQDELGPGDSADAYAKCREASGHGFWSDQGEQMYRIVDDYYNEPLPKLIFYKCQIFDGGRIKSRSMMSQYTSQGSDQKEGFHADEHGVYTRGMGVDPNYGRSFADEDFGDYTPPKLGGKESKTARKYVNAQKANDELIIYALVSPRVNKYTSIASIHTGTVKLYVFQLDRNFPEES